MAIRIAGVDIPQNKRGEIALTYIFGIGRSSGIFIFLHPFSKGLSDFHFHFHSFSTLHQWEWPQKMFARCAQACPTLCDPIDCSPTSSSIHMIFQAKILEWIAISSSRGIFLTPGLNPYLLQV